ncbi:hypothetical protein RB195_004008 [Necator americanus]|uniref:Uncharacterized protein n=1 Tax=Necator americanus TaxID=51031 RepID=A0ABR1DR92_NECAM
MGNFRYIILFASTISSTFIYSNRVVFGFTVICQEPENKSSNITLNDYYLADPTAKAWMFSATAVGMCLGPIPLYWAYKFDTRFLSTSEMSLIVEGRKAVTKKSPVPYLDLFADVTIWTSFIMFIGYYVGMIIYQQYSPTFIKQVLNYTVRETGYFAAIPMIFAIILKVGIGKVIDHGLGLSAKWRLAAPLLVLETLSAASIFLTGFRGAQHAHFALNFNMFIAGFVQILLPGGVQLLVPDNTKDQWATLFYGLAAMIMATTTLYLFCTTAKAAPWTIETSTVRKEDVICSTVPSCSKIQV